MVWTASGFVVKGGESERERESDREGKREGGVIGGGGWDGEIVERKGARNGRCKERERGGGGGGGSIRFG